VRVLIVHAHPSPTSFTAEIARETRASLVESGHIVEACDLYAEKFDPVLPLETSLCYLEVPANRAGVERYVQNLLAADALVFVFPVWHDGPPAILKGYFDRVFVRGVVFDINTDGVFYPLLQGVGRLAAIALYGANRTRTRLVGDLPRRFVRHNLSTLIAPDAQVDYFAAYDMDRGDRLRRDRFVKKVRRAFRSW
jgi:NAD(P)H dehydrogenase (quinone)